MIVTIRDVGQGDSIVIEWVDFDNHKRLGLIDCHFDKDNVKNLIKYIIDNKFSCIEFIIITHPHFDHYSGLTSLFLNLKKIKGFFIKNLFQSFLPKLKNEEKIIKLLKSYHKKSEDKSDLPLLKLVDLTNFIIKNTTSINDNPESLINQLSLISGGVEVELKGSEYYLKFFGPRSREFLMYRSKEKEKMQVTDHDISKIENVNNPDANLLSIICGIIDRKSNAILALFTSDSIKYVLRKIKKIEERNENFIFEDVKLIQIPHHGSKYNHDKKFWDNFNIKESTSFVSVGMSSYNHPDSDVIKYWMEKTNELHRTDIINADQQQYSLNSHFSGNTFQNNLILEYSKEEKKWIRNI